MVDVKTAWQIEEKGCWLSGGPDYSDIYKQFGEVVVEVEQDDYQGDTLVLLKKDGKYGYLTFGWGSCSGCDALEACETIKELQELCDELEQQIKWFDTVEEARDFMTNHDWEGDHFWYHKDLRKFPKMALEALK